ncbi:MAG: hypothetical protein ACI8PZ_007391, partial [Myxococcota bacterium]
CNINCRGVTPCVQTPGARPVQWGDDDGDGCLDAAAW